MSDHPPPCTVQTIPKTEPLYVAIAARSRSVSNAPCSHPPVIAARNACAASRRYSTHPSGTITRWPSSWPLCSPSWAACWRRCWASSACSSRLCWGGRARVRRRCCAGSGWCRPRWSRTGRRRTSTSSG